MINTIFYFIDTEDEYRQKMAKGEIDSETIVFVRESREIYLNGYAYGKTSTAGLVNNDRFILLQTAIEGRLAAISSEIAQSDLALSDRLTQELQDATSELEQSIQDAQDTADAIAADLELTKTDISSDIATSILNAMTNAQGRTLWSEVNRANDGVSAITTKLNVALDNDGNVKYTQSLQSVINTGIDNNTAFTDLSSRWAVLNENQELIEWVASGFESLTEESGSFAEMYTAAMGEQSDAIAAVKTEVLTDMESNYVAKAGLATQVTGIIEDELEVESLSDIVLQSDLADATATITTRVDGINNSLASLALKSEVSAVENTLVGYLQDGNGNVITSASLQQSATNNAAKLTALANWNGNNLTSFKGGVITESSIDGVIASLIADSSSGTKAAITAQVNADASNITLSADLIYLAAGVTLANTIRATGGSIANFVITENNLSSTAGKGTASFSSNTSRMYYGYDALSGSLTVLLNLPELVLRYDDTTEHDEYEDYTNMISITPLGIVISGMDAVNGLSVFGKISSDGSGYLGSGVIKWDNFNHAEIGHGALLVNGNTGEVMFGLNSEISVETSLNNYEAGVNVEFNVQIPDEYEHIEELSTIPMKQYQGTITNTYFYYPGDIHVGNVTYPGLVFEVNSFNVVRLVTIEGGLYDGHGFSYGEYGSFLPNERINGVDDIKSIMVLIMAILARCGNTTASYDTTTDSYPFVVGESPVTVSYQLIDIGGEPGGSYTWAIDPVFNSYTVTPQQLPLTAGTIYSTEQFKNFLNVYSNIFQAVPDGGYFKVVFDVKGTINGTYIEDTIAQRFRKHSSKRVQINKGIVTDVRYTIV